LDVQQGAAEKVLQFIGKTPALSRLVHGFDSRTRCQTAAPATMHKDPPPSFFERPVRRLVIEGLITGFIISIIVVGAWALTASYNAKAPADLVPALNRGR
jgi:hypothetical protein